MWPFTKKLDQSQEVAKNATFDDIKEYMIQAVQQSKAHRKALGITPTSDEWALLMDIGNYLHSLAPTFPLSIQSEVERAYRVFLDAEKEMDFELTALAASCMSYFVYHIMPGESEQEFQFHLRRDVIKWKNEQTAK